MPCGTQKVKNVETALIHKVLHAAVACHAGENCSPDGDGKMKGRYCHWFITAMVMLLGTVWPMKADAAEALRFRHAVSLYTDDQGMGLKRPQGVTCLDSSILVVADTANNRLLRFALTADDAKPEVTAWKPPAMVYPQRIRQNRQGDIYVLDGKLRRVLHLSPEGKDLGFLDPIGVPLPEQIAIRSFDIDLHGNIYFLDVLSKRVLACNGQGEVLRQIQFPEAFGFFSDLAVDTRESVFLLDSVNGQVFSAKPGAPQFSPLGKQLKEFVRFPTSLALDPQGRIYLVDRNGSKIVVLAQDGTYIGKFSDLGWKEGLLNHPSQICLTEQGGLVVADTSNNRVQIFRPLK